MSTVTKRPGTWNREATQERVAHPLGRLRGYIRTYVTLEGLAVLAIYLALVFWVGLLLDYGVFKAFGVDWVQILPGAFRGGVLAILSIGLIGVLAVKVLLRFFREFSPPALALVLERKFPKILGDRLITAVELADPKLAVRYGYSQDMIDKTIQDAAAKVEEIPVREVFTWNRLWRYGLVVLLLTAGLYLLTGAGYCAVQRTTDAGQFVQSFGDVATIWFERNVLLIDTIWPRRAFLELVGFPESGQMKIGRDAPPPTLRVRAWQWVVADKTAPEGWRALIWADLKPELLGETDVVAKANLSGEWAARTVDSIELLRDRQDDKNPFSTDQIIALANVFGKLTERADAPGMNRKLRKLVIPDEAFFKFKGKNNSGEQSLQKETDHEYSVTLTELKETIEFTIRGEDYYTAKKHIIVVPPPTLVEVLRADAQPAYLFHRIPARGRKDDLRGEKQKLQEQPISLTGEASQLQVPFGSDITLTARTDKDLQVPGGVRFVSPRKGVPEVNLPIEQLYRDPKSFRVAFKKVTVPIDFLFEFTDTDNVLGRRRIVIKPVEDVAPEVDVQVEVLRKTNQGYLCTALARAPFSGKVRDDNGLASVEYAYTLTKVEAQSAIQARLALVGNLVCSTGTLAAAKLGALSLMSFWDPSAGEEEKVPTTEPLTTFLESLRSKDRESLAVTPDQLKQLLSQADAPRKPLVKDHVLDPKFEEFKIEKLGLARDEKDYQPKYRLRLWVTATDTNLETGPKVGDSKEKFTLMIVSENELLAEIAKEEESLHVKLEETFNRLQESQTKLAAVLTELPKLKEDEFSPMTRRAEEIEETIAKAWDVARDVDADYNRILNEMMINQVKSTYLNKVKDSICTPLDRAINPDVGEFGDAEKTMKAFKDALVAKTKDVQAGAAAKESLDNLIASLRRILDSMGDIQTINKLIESLVKIKNAEEEEYQRLLEIKREKEKIILEGLDAVPPKK